MLSLQVLLIVGRLLKSSFKLLDLVLLGLPFSLDLVQSLLDLSLLTKDCFLVLLHLGNMLLDLTLLEFFLLDLGLKDTNFVL